MSSNKNYRLDGRSEEEFRRQIKDRTMQERSLFLLWLDLLEKSTGTRPVYKDIGCGKTGDYLPDEDVTMEPDFEVEGYGKVEVKFSKPMLDRMFHLKVGQVKSYHKSNASILMVNGADFDTPKFTMLKTDALKQIIDFCEVTRWRGFGGKAAYRIPVDMFIWRDLK
jgi:hypothetical protein